MQRMLEGIYKGNLSRPIYSGAKRAHYDTIDLLVFIIDGMEMSIDF